MPPSLDLLRTFLAVYREGSLTAAADRMSMSQPTVTAQVKALEATLGRPLFTRLPRGVTPTPVADLLARRIAGPLDELDELGVVGALGALVAGEAPSPLAGVVQLGGPAELLGARVLPSLAGLVAEGLQLRVTLGTADELVAGLASGAVDLAVLTARPRRRGLRVDPLCDEEFVLVAAPRWAERLAAAPDLARGLADVPLVSYAEVLPIVRRYWRSVFGTRPPRDAAAVVPDLRAVLALLIAGAGYSALPTYLCDADVDAGRLVVLHRPALPPINTLLLGTRSGAPSSPAVATVHGHLKRAARSW